LYYNCIISKQKEYHKWLQTTQKDCIKNVNFSLPFSNNLTARALRGIKSKMKISGQFLSEESTKNYAAIESYIETCYRNGINEIQALMRLCEGNPYTIREIFEK
jgi:transposase